MDQVTSPESDLDEALALLRDMVDTSSPTGREESLARYLANWGRQRGLHTRLQPLGPGRANVIVTLAGTGDGPSLLFNGHLDTSYTGDEDFLEGVGYKPKALIRDGWLFGLGVFNMKSGLAAALMALSTLAHRSERLNGDVIVAGVCGEIEKACVDQFQGPEYTGYGFGTTRLLAHGVHADYGCVCEPTNFKVSHGQLGALWIKVTIQGDMVHTTFFDEQSNDHAIYRAARIVEAIRTWAREYQNNNSYEGQRARVHVGSIQGGWPWRISRTPRACSLYVDIRTNPRQRPEAVLAEFKNVVRAAVVNMQLVEIEPYVIVPSIVARGDELVFDAVRSAHQRAFSQLPATEFRGPMADSGHMIAAGIPTVTYGLGPTGNFDIPNPITKERGEQIRIEDYHKLISIYIDTARYVSAKEQVR